MKTTSVALFLALSAGYLNAANAESLNNIVPRVAKATLAGEPDANAERHKKSATAVVKQKQSHSKT